MRLLIAAIGRSKNGPEADLNDRYLKRARALSSRVGLRGPDVVEREAPKGRKGAELANLEAELLLKAAPEDAFIVALDESGEPLASQAIATHIEDWRFRGTSTCMFALGGAAGHGEALLDRAQFKLALGYNTWPHMLARVLLAEQIYRSLTLLCGHPYHKE